MATKLFALFLLVFGDIMPEQPLPRQHLLDWSGREFFSTVSVVFSCSLVNPSMELRNCTSCFSIATANGTTNTTSIKLMQIEYERQQNEHSNHDSVGTSGRTNVVKQKQTEMVNPRISKGHQAAAQFNK